MPLTELKQVLTRKKIELRSKDVNWSWVEEKIGTALPADYKNFVDYYGPGSVDEFIFILSPVSSNKYLNIFHMLETLEKSKSVSISAFKKNLMPPLYPEGSGYIPFGYTENGDFLYWKAVGLPDSWNIAVFESRSLVKEEFKICMTEFLRSLIAKELTVEAFPEDALYDKSEFFPSE